MSGDFDERRWRSRPGIDEPGRYGQLTTNSWRSRLAKAKARERVCPVCGGILLVPVEGGDRRVRLKSPVPCRCRNGRQ